MPRSIRETKPMQRAAMLTEPCAFFPVIAKKVIDEGPERLRVIEVNEMCDLMCRDIVKNVGRRHDEPP